MQVIDKWAHMLTLQSTEHHIRQVHSALGLNLGAVSTNMPKFDEQDITLVKKDQTFEVYAHRDFQAYSLLLAPDCTEFKDKYWTQTRSVLVINGADLHPDHKHIVLDGRLRSVPCDSRPMALFFVVTRSKEPHECNMTVDYCATEISCKITLPFPAVKKRAISQIYEEAQTPQIPIMFNKKLIKKGTKLVCGVDCELERLHALQQQEKKAKK